MNIPIFMGHSGFQLLAFSNCDLTDTWGILGVISYNPLPKHFKTRGSLYGIFTYIYHKNQPNVGIYTIHGSYGKDIIVTTMSSQLPNFAPLGLVEALNPPVLDPPIPWMQRQFPPDRRHRHHWPVPAPVNVGAHRKHNNEDLWGGFIPKNTKSTNNWMR